MGTTRSDAMLAAAAAAREDGVRHTRTASIKEKS